jgi:hypothetical protein
MAIKSGSDGTVCLTCDKLKHLLQPVQRAWPKQRRGVQINPGQITDSL